MDIQTINNFFFHQSLDAIPYTTHACSSIISLANTAGNWKRTPDKHVFNDIKHR